MTNDLGTFSIQKNFTFDKFMSKEEEEIFFSAIDLVKSHNPDISPFDVFLKLRSFGFNYIVDRRKVVAIIGNEVSIHDTDCFGLFWFYIHPDYQKKGIGTRLLKHVIDSCKKQQFIKNKSHGSIMLATRSELIPFYIRFGFNVIYNRKIKEGSVMMLELFSEKK